MDIKETCKKWEVRFEKMANGEINPPDNQCNKPYDSEWEKEFEYVLSKNLPDEFILYNQYALCEKYRADFAIKHRSTGKVWVFEFDGKQWHDKAKDKLRDARILECHDEINSITRVDANTWRHEYLEVRAMLNKLTPECFDRFMPSCYLYWEKNGDEYTAQSFSGDDIDCWRDDEGGYLNDMPTRSLSIIHRNRNV